MHILTKVFVVLAAVMSLMLSALTIMYAVNAESIRESYLTAERDEEAAKTALQVLQESNARLSASMQAELDERDQRIASLEREVSRLGAERDRLQRDVRTSQAEASKANARVDGFRVSNQTLSELVENYRGEVSGLRDAELANREQRLELEDRIADQSSQLLVLESTVRALREQLAEANRRIQDGGSGTAVASVGAGLTRAAAGAASEGRFIIAGRPIRGRVEAVREDPATGETLVRVSLGSNDRMAENAELSLHRGPTFLGKLVLTSVDLQSSTGRVLWSAEGAEVRVGDQVATKFLN